MLLRFAHVLLAMIAVGANLTYALWLRIGERDPEHLAYTIRGIRAIDRRVANPAYALLLVTGLAMVVFSGVPLAQGWLVVALALYVAAALSNISASAVMPDGLGSSRRPWYSSSSR